MFSATFNKEFRRLAKYYLADNHVRLRVGRAGSVHRNVVQEVRRPVEASRLINTDHRMESPDCLDRPEPENEGPLRSFDQYASCSYFDLCEQQGTGRLR
jgi:hypothetical protein